MKVVSGELLERRREYAHEKYAHENRFIYIEENGYLALQTPQCTITSLNIPFKGINNRQVYKTSFPNPAKQV